MSLDFYDKNGRAYAYSKNGEVIYTYTGIPIAYIHDDSIFSFSGAHIGYFNDGILRDSRGAVLLFTNGAVGGSMKPMKQMKPMKSMKQMRPMKGLKQMKPMRPMKTMGWSEYLPEDIFEN